MPEIISCCFSLLKGEGGTNIVGSILDMAALCDADDEKAEEDVPQIKGQLFPQMCADKGGLPTVFRLIVIGIDSKTGFFVDVGFAHGDGDGEDGNVHHNYSFP